MTTRITWLCIGLVVGCVVGLYLFAEPLCRKGVLSKANGLLDSVGVSQDSKVREILGGVLNG